MNWASALSIRNDVDSAAEEAAETLVSALGTRTPDLVAAFAASAYGEMLDALADRLAARFPQSTVVGCAAHGVIGGGREIEGRPALALVGACLPGGAVEACRLTDAQSPSFALGRPDCVVVLADPFSVDPDRLIARLDAAWPGCTVIGGLASGAAAPGETRLFARGRVWRSGAVLVALRGVAVDAVIAPGCRPIGPPMIVTRCDGNLILELNQQRPLAVLTEALEPLPPEERRRVAAALHVGVEMRPDQVECGPSDFLVRNVLGFTPDGGSLAIGAAPRPGQVLQFLVRDAAAAAQDLDRRLEAWSTAAEGARPTGGLLFSCVGRGEQLFGVPDHDTELFKRRVGDVPLGGFFGNGEIGPVAGTTFLHGYTSAFALFRETPPRTP